MATKDAVGTMKPETCWIAVAIGEASVSVREERSGVFASIEILLQTQPNDNTNIGEFLISDGSEGKTQVVDVTAPGGAPISNKGGRSGGGRGGGYGGGGGRRIGGGELSTCYNMSWLLV
ncbi:hypothetical protein ACFE04_005751 [Oxalis oulophora]